MTDGSCRFAFADIDREDRRAVFIEYDPVGTYPQSVTVPAGKALDISPPADGIGDQAFGYLLADIGRQVVEIASRRHREDDRLHSDNIADLSPKVKRYYWLRLSRV